MVSDPRKKSPLVLPNYPYAGKFTNEQIADALARKDKLVDLLMDPVGPDGTLINLPVDMMHILAFHLAYAGADTHTDNRQLIESRKLVDDSQMFEMYEWRPRGEFGDQPSESAVPDGEAVSIATQMRQQLTPEVRAAVATILMQEYSAATDSTITDRERANGVLLEQKMKEGNA